MRLASAVLCAIVLCVAGEAGAEVTAKNAWVRGTVKGQTATGAFMTITSTENAKLVGIRSAAAPMVELHASSMDKGVMQMHAIEALDLPAGKPVELKPGGHHVMMMGLDKPLAAGARVPFTLVVESGGKRAEVPVEAEVRPLGK
ncbi:MAG TPA: copper chaperone PCu(A)C [Casimicrobiaceae bacterium]